MSKFIESFSTRNPKQPPARLFLALDGEWLVSDHLGTRRASALALALLAKPDHRANGSRVEVSNG
jgi:hypothetical protein